MTTVRRLIPKSDYFLCREERVEQKTAAGLILPVAASGESRLVKEVKLVRVSHVSEGPCLDVVGADGKLMHREMPVREGDLAYVHGALPCVTLDGVPYLLGQAHQVCAVIEEVVEAATERLAC